MILVNLTDLHNHCIEEMAKAKKEYDECGHMIYNAKQDEIDYHDWPQYHDMFKLRARWEAYREMKEILGILLDPSVFDKNKELEEITGVKL